MKKDKIVLERIEKKLEKRLCNRACIIVMCEALPDTVEQKQLKCQPHRTCKIVMTVHCRVDYVLKCCIVMLYLNKPHI